MCILWLEEQNEEIDLKNILMALLDLKRCLLKKKVMMSGGCRCLLENRSQISTVI